LDFNDDMRRKYQAVSTATLTSVLLKRGFRNTFIGGIKLVNPNAPRMVGPAYTLRYIPAREDLDQPSAFDGRKHPQRIAVENCPPGHVMVFDSRKDASAASAGGILVTRMYKRGIAGVVTDGGFRDSPDIEKLPFPVYHSRPSAPTNLIKHHALDINAPRTDLQIQNFVRWAGRNPVSTTEAIAFSIPTSGAPCPGGVPLQCFTMTTPTGAPTFGAYPNKR